MPPSLRVLGIIFSIPLVVLVGLGLVSGLSPSGWLMSLAATLVVVGMIRAPERRAVLRAMAPAGLALLLLIAIGRCIGTARGDTTMVTLPAGSGSRWLGRLVDEEDGSLVGMRLLLGVLRFAPGEREQILPAMRDAYVAMRQAEGVTASPVLDTLLGRQRSERFDAVVIEPHRGVPDSAVVFLHGYAGSFTLQCWMVADAARAIDAVTVCPSTSFDGRWGSRDGERTLRATIAYLHERSLRRIYLVGLSNGGVGASQLAPRFAGSLAGLVLISGVSASGSTGGLPTLVVHGNSDQMASAQTARAFAARTGATYAGFAGGHFVLMVRRLEVRDAIAAWLRAQPTARR